VAISKTYIRNDNIRAAFNSLLANYPSYEAELTKKRSISYHDHTGKKYTGNVEPHFALTSEMQYQMVREKIAYPSWWDVCDIIVGYWVYNLSTGSTYSAETSANIVAYIQSLAPSLSTKKIEDTLGVWSRHVKDVHALYGSYLFNPSTLVNLRGVDQAASTISYDSSAPVENPKSRSGVNMGLALAAGLAGVVFLKSNNKKRR